MRSRTKVELDRATLESRVHATVPGLGPVTSVRPLTDGMFNAAYSVRLADSARLVVKVAPPPDVPVLTYERRLMPAEVDFYQRTAGLIPVPEVLGVDLGGPDRDLFVMQHLSGKPLHAVRRALPAADRAAVQRDLGALVARLRTVRGTRFGYDRPDGALSSDRWSTAFATMVQALLGDVERFGVRVPLAAWRLPALVASARAELDRVRTPVLVHFDLWEGNVFVAPRDAQLRLEAVVDGERAFWGDPLAELASTALFRDPARAADFLAGYAAEAGEPLDLGQGATVRLGLYRAYLYLIMAVEGAPRGYRGVEHTLVGAFVRNRLAREVGRLERTLG